MGACLEEVPRLRTISLSLFPDCQEMSSLTPPRVPTTMCVSPLSKVPGPAHQGLNSLKPEVKNLSLFFFFKSMTSGILLQHRRESQITKEVLGASDLYDYKESPSLLLGRPKKHHTYSRAWGLGS